MAAQQQQSPACGPHSYVSCVFRARGGGVTNGCFAKDCTANFSSSRRKVLRRLRSAADGDLSMPSPGSEEHRQKLASDGSANELCVRQLLFADCELIGQLAPISAYPATKPAASTNTPVLPIPALRSRTSSASHSVFAASHSVFAAPPTACLSKCRSLLSGTALWTPNIRISELVASLT